MNLFILALLPKECAEYMIDKHVHKILLEAVQMLCSAYRIIEPDQSHEGIYKLAHKNHPVTIWCRTSLENYIWTLDLVDALHEEWRYRHDHTKTHKSYLVAQQLRENLPNPAKFEKQGLTPFALAMPDQYKTDDPIESYRNYYKGEKSKMASWKKRNKPDFMN